MMMVFFKRGKRNTMLETEDVDVPQILLSFVFI